MNAEESSFSFFCPVSSNAFFCPVSSNAYWVLTAVIILHFYCSAMIAWRCFSFLVSHAFTTMLAKRGIVLCVDVLGTTFIVC